MVDDDPNIEITKDELLFIRSISDLDLTMFLSELHDFGWPQARLLLPMIKEAIEAHKHDEQSSSDTPASVAHQPRRQKEKPGR